MVISGVGNYYIIRLIWLEDSDFETTELLFNEKKWNEHITVLIHIGLYMLKRKRKNKKLKYGKELYIKV